MKTLYLSAIVFLSALPAFAQDSWTIKINNKIIFTANRENETANVKKLKASGLDKKGCLEVIYHDKNQEPDWIRSFILTDEDGNDIIRKDSTTALKIDLKTVKKEFHNRKKIIIYTFKIPADPDLAARVRIRRVHLCTLELQ